MIRPINAGQSVVFKKRKSPLVDVPSTHTPKARIVLVLVRLTLNHLVATATKKLQRQTFVTTAVDGRMTTQLFHPAERNTNALRYVDNTLVVTYLINGRKFYVRQSVKITIVTSTVSSMHTRSQVPANRQVFWR